MNSANGLLFSDICIFLINGEYNLKQVKVFRELSIIERVESGVYSKLEVLLKVRVYFEEC